MNARHRSRHAAAALALIAGIALAGCSSAPKRPDPTPLGAVPPILQVAQAWHAELGAALPQTFSPVLAAGGVVVAAADGSVARFDATSGRELWRSRVPGGISAGVGSDGRFSAVVNARNQLASLGPQGQLLWLYQLPTSVITPPLVARGVIVVQGADQHLWAFDAADGKVLWDLELRAPALLLQHAGGLTLDGDVLLVGDALGRIDAVALSSGVLRWQTTLAHPRGSTEVERMVPVTGAPALADGAVCAQTFDATIACVDADGGALRWSVDAHGASAPSQNGNTLVATQGDGVVQAYAMADGKPLWHNDQLKYRGLSAPLLVGATVAVGDYQGYVSLLSAHDGALVGRFDTDGSAIRSPLLADGSTMIAVTARGGVYAYRPR
jgi:outer membrane assembly lipoprotein YfgL